MNSDIRQLLDAQLQDTLQRQGTALASVLVLLRNLQELAHAIQRERGSTSLRLTDQNHLYVGLMNEFRLEVDHRQQALLSSLQESLPRQDLAAMGHRFFRKLELALQAIDLLAALRRDVNASQMTSDQSTLAYSHIVEALLAVAFELAQFDNPPAVMRLLVALVYTMQGKELAGQERALLGAGFASGGVPAALKTALAHRIEGQQHCLEIFMEQAPPELVATHQAFMAGPVASELARLRAAAQHATAATPCERPALYWFDRSTGYIDHLRVLESRLSEQLMTACEKGVTLDHPASVLPAATALPTPASKPAVTNPGTNRATSAATNPATNATLGLIATQTRRILAVETELLSLQQVLGERHLIERAKAMIMSREGIEEHEAYQRMRKTSMDTGARLTAIARQVIARFSEP